MSEESNVEGKQQDDVEHKIKKLKYEKVSVKRIRTKHHLLRALYEREIYGGGIIQQRTRFFNQVPARLRADFLQLECPCPIILGFSSCGTSLYGYYPHATQARIVIAGYDINLANLKASENIFTFNVPAFPCSDGISGEVLYPTSIIDCRSKFLLISRYVDLDSGIKGCDVQCHVCFIDTEDPRFGSVIQSKYTLLNPELTADILTPLSSIYHVSQEEEFSSVAFDLGTQLRILHFSTKPFQISTIHWCRKTNEDCEVVKEINFSSPRKAHYGNSARGAFCCRTVDTEAFLIEHLQSMLKCKISLEIGTVALVDYAVQFIRFISSKSFEFIAVARVLNLASKFVCVFVVQVSLSGFRILQRAKREDTNISLRDVCSTLVERRRRGYHPDHTTRMTNEAVLRARPIQIMKNPVLPFEIYFAHDPDDCASPH